MPDKLHIRATTERHRRWVLLAYASTILLGAGYLAAIPLMAGFTGYVAFGYVAFFGLGSYATAILVSKLDFPVPLAIVCAGLVGVVASLAFSRILSLRGIYFSMVSLAIAVICRNVVSMLPVHIAGGAQGLSLGANFNPRFAYYSLSGNGTLT